MKEIIADDQATFDIKMKKINAIYWRLVLSNFLAVLCLPAVMLAPKSSWVYIFIFMGALALSQFVQMALFKCPNCGKTFFSFGRFTQSRTFYAKECVNCGFPRVL